MIWHFAGRRANRTASIPRHDGIQGKSPDGEPLTSTFFPRQPTPK